jgi:cell wall-associated NlpC family hydrolase
VKIKKVDDKPMVIHTKEKAKIHSHEPKSASIKGSNIYTVDRTPKIKKAAVSEKPAKVRNTSDYIKGKNKQAYRKSTKHGTDSTRENGISRFRRTVRESSQSVKLKETNLHVAGRTGAAGVKAATDQMEGGQEVQQAAYFAYEATRPVTGTASKGAALFRKKSAEAKKRKIKKVEAGKKLAKKTAKKAATETAKNTAKETAKETAKTVAKKTAKTAATAAASTAGTAVAPGVGTAIGIAAGYASGVAIEAKDTQISNRNRKIKFFLDKMKAEENQQDSIVKLAKDLITRRAVLWVKTVAPIAGMVLLLLVLLVAMVAVPVVAVLGVLYNSPFALFLPALESGDTVQTVTSAYVSEFNRDINTLANDHTGYDAGEIVYVDYEGTDANPSNYYDIMAVYMVKYGVGDTATIMNDTSKSWLKAVVDDMCSYTTSTGSKTDTVTNEDGTTSTTTTTYLYVNVTLKSYRDMISVYGFGSDEVEMLEQIMSADFMGQLGWTGGGGGGSPGVSSMTEAEISAVLSGISDSTQRTVCDYALHRVGYPYSQDYRDSGNYYDCSSLVYYSWKSAGKSIAYGGATTAAAEAEGLDSAGKTVSYDEMQPGDLIFYSFTNNGRYKNISHVAVYVGNGKVVEALNENSGVVYRDVSSVGSIVLIGRP